MGCLWSQRKCTGVQASSSEQQALNGGTGGGVKPTKNAPHYLRGGDTDRPQNFQQVDIDPRMPFNKQQAFKLVQSWRGIKRNISGAGVEMFAQLFKTSPPLQAMFQSFKDIKSDDELRANESLENHATLVMNTLDDAITHIDNYDYVKDLLYKTGVSHTKFDHFKPDYFLAIKEPFLEAVRVTLGDRYTENMQNIYTIAITFILQTLKEGMEEALGDLGPGAAKNV